VVPGGVGQSIARRIEPELGNSRNNIAIAGDILPQDGAFLLVIVPTQRMKDKRKWSLSGSSISVSGDGSGEEYLTQRICLFPRKLSSRCSKIP